MRNPDSPGTPGDTPIHADQQKGRTAEKNTDAATVPALSEEPTKKEMEAAIAALNAMMALPSATPAAPEHRTPLVAAALVSEFEDTSAAVAEAVVESEGTSLLDEAVVVSEFDDASLPEAEPVVSESGRAALPSPSKKSAVVEEVVAAMREMREEGDTKVEKEKDVPSEPAWQVPEGLAAAATLAASLVFVNASFFSDVGTEIRSSPTPPVAAVRPASALPSNQGPTGATFTGV